MLCAQIPPVSAQIGIFGPDQGLPQSMVKDMVQDSRGVLWISTGGGVCRYDGNSLTPVQALERDGTELKFSAPQGKMFLNSKGDVWIGGQPGLFASKAGAGNLKSISQLIHGNKKENAVILGGSHDVVYISSRGSSLLEMDTRNERVKVTDLKKRGFTRQGIRHWIPLGDRIYCELTDSILILNEAGTKVYFRFQIASYGFTEVIPLGGGKLLMCSNRGPAMVLDPQSGKFYPATEMGLPAGQISHAEVKGNELVYVSGRNQLMVCRLIENHCMDHRRLFPDYQEVFGSYEITRLFIDRNSLLWVGTDGLGLVRLNLSSRRMWKPSDFTDDFLSEQHRFVRGICETSSGRILVSTLKDGILEYDRNLKPVSVFSEKFPVLKGGEGGAIFRDSEGQIWISANHGIYCYLEKTGEMIRTGIEGVPKNEVFTALAFCTGENRKMWCASTYGVFEYKPETRSWKCVHDYGSRILTVYTDGEGRLWTGKYWGPLNVYNQRGFGPASVPVKTIIETDNVRMIVYDSLRKLYLIATEVGLLTADARLKIRRIFNQKNGLSNEFVYGVLTDHRGRYWISTNSGIHCISPERGGVRYFGLADGAQSREFNSGAGIFTSGGIMVFGGISGINYFRPDELMQPPALRDVFLLDAVFRNSGTGEVEPYSGKNMVLHSGFDFAEISFVFPDYAEHQGVKYYYKLDGKSGWVSLGSRNRLILPRLAAGSYQIMVKAKDHTGMESREKLLLTFRVKPRFHQTLLFLLLIILGGGILVFMFTRYFYRQKLRLAKAETQRIAEIQNLRSSISRELHDNLGASLSRVSLMTHKLRVMPEKTDVNEAVASISGLAVEMNRQLRNIVWSISQEYDTLESLQSYIRLYAHTVLEENNIIPDIRISAADETLKLRPDVRQSLFAIVKEILNNSIKYSGTDKMEIVFTTDLRRNFVLSIVDFGAGFHYSGNKQFSHGIKNIHGRMNDLGFEAVMQTAPGKGVTWTVTGKFHTD